MKWVSAYFVFSFNILDVVVAFCCSFVGFALRLSSRERWKRANLLCSTNRASACFETENMLLQFEVWIPCLESVELFYVSDYLFVYFPFQSHKEEKESRKIQEESLRWRVRQRWAKCICSMLKQCTDKIAYEESTLDRSVCIYTIDVKVEL